MIYYKEVSFNISPYSISLNIAIIMSYILTPFAFPPFRCQVFRFCSKKHGGYLWCGSIPYDCMALELLLKYQILQITLPCLLKLGPDLIFSWFYDLNKRMFFTTQLMRPFYAGPFICHISLVFYYSPAVNKCSPLRRPLLRHMPKNNASKRRR